METGRRARLIADVAARRLHMRHLRKFNRLPRVTACYRARACRYADAFRREVSGVIRKNNWMVANQAMVFVQKGNMLMFPLRFAWWAALRIAC